MLPEPLHPAVVHFPVVLAALLPVAALAGLISTRRNPRSRAPWLWVVAISVALAGASWLAVETGEEQEEVVERVVPESALEAHEDAANTFLLMSGAAVLLFGAGLAKGRVGEMARYAGLAGSLILVAAGYRVGEAGGALVYEYGAAQAYAAGSPASAGSPGGVWGEEERERRDR